MKKPFSCGIKLSGGNHGKPRLFSDLAITMVLMAKRVFLMLSRVL
ncbi:hypothetical protein BTN50_0454 [Candidatus Enterovibrio altilux]|uniref:Uncharacterized protein n=1 Tax=Candidatus Enterovibrio altilux TaxID=1927128 RepID=A0A291B7L5_9GAMM|nr:hypothetical protein BTN50_0454 [Candidatus Enterovibrio luxaltus]